MTAAPWIWLSTRSGMATKPASTAMSIWGTRIWPSTIFTDVGGDAAT